MKRIESLKQIAFEKENIDCLLVLDGTNLRYLIDFSGATALLIPKRGKNRVFVYGVNYVQAKEELSDFDVELVSRNENLMDEIARQITVFKTERLAVDTLVVENWRDLTKFLGGETKILAGSSFLKELRQVKDEKEVELMRKAGELTSEGMQVAYEVVAPGMREYEVAAEIEYAMRKHGSYGTAFDTIVASGSCSAYPHGGCSSKKIQKGEIVVIDVGATYEYYRSDMSRTLVVGKPSEKQKKIYKIVKTAQEKSIEAIKPDSIARNIDAVARKIIADAGYGEYFVHSLGHGVGLDVHEPPTLGPHSKEILTTDNVFTVEPGIYIPGYGGFRIEDTVLLQKKGLQKLTKGPYALNSR